MTAFVWRVSPICVTRHQWGCGAAGRLWGEGRSRTPRISRPCVGTMWFRPTSYRLVRLSKNPRIAGAREQFRHSAKPDLEHVTSSLPKAASTHPSVWRFLLLAGDESTRFAFPQHGVLRSGKVLNSSGRVRLQDAGEGRYNFPPPSP